MCRCVCVSIRNFRLRAIWSYITPTRTTNFTVYGSNNIFCIHEQHFKRSTQMRLRLKMYHEQRPTPKWSHFKQIFICAAQSRTLNFMYVMKITSCLFGTMRPPRVPPIKTRHTGGLPTPGCLFTVLCANTEALLIRLWFVCTAARFHARSHFVLRNSCV